MSPRHAFPTAAALTKMAWHGGVRSFRCELRQALMRPPPGSTPPHAALTSAAHSFATARCCAIELVVESSTMAPIAKIFFSIVCPPVLHAGHAWACHPATKSNFVQLRSKFFSHQPHLSLLLFVPSRLALSERGTATNTPPPRVKRMFPARPIRSLPRERGRVSACCRSIRHPVRGG